MDKSIEFHLPDASWPFNISSSTLEKLDFPDLYTSFKQDSEKHLGKVAVLKPHLLSERIFRLATCDSVIDVVKDFIGNDINIWSSAFFAKAPNSSKYVGFHQDNPYWQLSSTNVVTAWIALTNSHKDNGCLQILSAKTTTTQVYPLDVHDSFASYRRGDKTTDQDDLISFNQKLPVNDLNNYIRHYVTLKSGQFSVHSVNAIHGSSRNTSSDPRIGFAVRYVDSHTHHMRDKNDSVLHVCGQHSFKPEIAPIGEFTSAIFFIIKMPLALQIFEANLQPCLFASLISIIQKQKPIKFSNLFT